jgi:beta-lactam-binding protein with PASTA domain/predicted Ser/Thr protein kinase
VTGRLGSGGMAEVFMARDELLGRAVAIKILHPEFARDRVFIERFRREAQAVASLNEPRIVSVYDWGSDDGTYYLVMEYVDGRNLKDILASDGPLTLERACEIASDACLALHFAHEHGIVHRDVKPANIVITERGQTKVMDFGIARAATETGQTVTQTGTVIGTAAYLSPEQAQGLPVDARSDVYSLGVVLFEMLAGEVPFKADTAVAVASMHVRETPPLPSSLNPDVPEALNAVVLKALAKNPDNRYETAEAMGRDIDRALRGEGVDAPAVLPEDQTMVVHPDDATRVISDAELEVSPRRRALAYTLIVLMFVGVLVAVVALLFNFLVGSGETLEVPDVTRLPLEEAEAMLLDTGFVVGNVTPRAHETVPPNHVIEQLPTALAKAREGSEVDLVVSSGPDAVPVPDVRGETLREAERILEAAGLEVGEITRTPSEEVEADHVIGQTPSPETAAAPGSSVDLVVSSGEATVRVPNLIGFSEERARSELEGRNLNPVVQERCDVARAHNTVLDQSPPGGDDVPEGSDVVIVVNRAPTVPNVQGDTEEDATEELGDAGFNVQVVTVDESPGPVNQGRVVDQEPDPNTRGCQGDTVTIQVEE